MIHDIRRIVVGVDLSDAGDLSAGSRLAVDLAHWLAGRVGARVTLVHSTRHEEHWGADEGAFVERPMRAGGASEPSLEAALRSLRAAGIDAELAFSDERAWLAIVERVLRSGADLVIVGKRSDAAHDSRLLGGVAQKLLRKCPCAVWVVKPGTPARPVRVLAATDLTPVGERAVSLAASIASECAAALHIAHAIQLPMSIQMEGADAQALFLAERRRAVIDALGSQLPKSALEKVEFHVGLTSPSNAILACAERMKVDLVVMGTISRAGIAGLAMGNTAERLLGHLDCSLLTVKPADFVCPVQLDDLPLDSQHADRSLRR